LIDCEEDRTVRAVLVGMLREGEGVNQRRMASRRPTETLVMLLGTEEGS
jgi:hypothetical protein